MSAVIQWVYPARDPISYVTASVIAVLALWLISQKSVPFEEDKHEFLTQLETAPPPLPTPQPIPKLSDPVAKPLPSPVKLPTPQPVIKESVSTQGDAPAPVPQQVTSPVQAVAAPVAPTPVTPIAKPDIKSEPVVVKAPSASQSQAYLSQLLAYLEQIKRYPSSREARQTRPQGTVKVWLEINRAGQLLDVGVVTSSGSNLLDSEALKTIRAGRFPPMPDDAFTGDVSHRFTASMKYSLD